MDPAAWGPPLWALLHSAAHQNRSHQSIRAALRAMRTCLPCCHCRGSLRVLLPQVEALQLPNDAEMLWALHNAVNRKLGKPEVRFVTAVRRWDVMTGVVDPIALLDSLLITAHNFEACGTKAKLRAYKDLWRAVADMCATVCTVSQLAGPLRGAARARSGAGIAKATNRARSAMLRGRNCENMILSDSEAAKRYGLARGKTSSV